MSVGRYARKALRRGGILLVALGIVDGVTNAQPPATPPEQATVTIEARRQAVEHQAYDYVRQVTQNPQFRDELLPRWNAPLCFAVAGLPTDQGQFALGRLREIAHMAGVHVGRPGCHYNFFVIFTAEPDALLKKAFHKYPKAFDQCVGAPVIREFIAPSKPRAVRVWHNIKPIRRDGMPIELPAWCGGLVADHTDFPVSLQYFPTKLERYDVRIFSLALVVVDTGYPVPAQLAPLVDYAALVGLADIDLDAAQIQVPSILRLFDRSSDPQPTGLTDWDTAFLSGLYQSDPATQTQRAQIVMKMSRRIVP